MSHRTGIARRVSLLAAASVLLGLCGLLPGVIAAAEKSGATVKSAKTDAKVRPATAAARADRLTAQLEAGEFGPALRTAEATSDVAERDRLIRQVAMAQTASGDFDSARRTSRRLATPESRVRARGEAARQQSFAGGGSGADFTQLIDLIQSQTGGMPDGPWIDIDGEGGDLSPFGNSPEIGGVWVDPKGQLSRLTKRDHEGRLASLGARARVAALNDDMAQTSGLRLVSLNRLEAAVAERIQAGQPVLETMRHLAGLTRVQYVFVYPESGEIILAGPAEGWQYVKGSPVGITSNRPTLQLDDLVTVLRTFSPSGEGIFGCSINPRPEGLKAVKEYVEASQAKGPLVAGKLGWFTTQIQERLGLQDIEVYGIPANTRVARVVVEADYQMKLIGIGKADGGKGIPSVFDLLPASDQKNPPALNALRWWLTMKYDAILHSPDRDVFEIQGSSVLVQSEDQFVTAQGQRVPGQSTAVNQLFAKNFTDHYAELAKRELVFADLQNVFDLGMAAALCRQHGLAQKAGWDYGVFAPNGEYRVTAVEAPKTVDSVVNHRVYRGKDIVVQAAGGVRCDTLSVARNEQLVHAAPQLTNVGVKAKAPQLPAGRWWWDAAR